MRAYFSSNSIIHALSSISKKSAYSKIVLYNERSRNPTDQSLISASTNKHSSRHDISYNNNQNRQSQNSTRDSTHAVTGTIYPTIFS